MKASRQRTLIAESSCEVRFDGLARQLYATDASIYQIEPFGVAFPRTVEETTSVICAAAEAGVSIIPRGAGTGLAGGAIGDGLVVDLARYHREILAFDPETKIVRVQPGVVLDQLNALLRPHGYWFGPDVATSSRATLGGMIANNSSGARAPVYGTTAEHVVSLDVVLADGRATTLTSDGTGLADVHNTVVQVVGRHADAVRERFPELFVKRWPGYGLGRFLRGKHGLLDILCGSEGTLAAIVSADLRVVPLPEEKGIAVLYFNSVVEAMRATVELLDLRPAAVEHVDHVLLDQTRGQIAFRATRDLLHLDSDPCPSLLIVEFQDAVEDRLNALSRLHLGERMLTITEALEMEMIWALRKAGLSLLTGRKGPAKPIAGIEDVSVRPEQLPEYVLHLQKLMDRHSLEASFYGHAASGLLHVRPIVDLHDPGQIARFRALCVDVSDLTTSFGGSIAAEHGVGMARTEFLAAHIGEDLVQTMRAIKQAFDPTGLFNPGKIVPLESVEPFRIETHLRQDPAVPIELPFEPVLAFASKDESFVANLEQCNGCGGCRKDAPTMCPTYIATHDEVMSTRGRANTIRAALTGRFGPEGHPLRSEELYEALSNCLSCKACAVECPSNVNLSLLKAELMHARHQEVGLTLREWLVSRVDLLGRLACLTPRLANYLTGLGLTRAIMDRWVGFTKNRPFPAFAYERFDTWFHRRPERAQSRGHVYLWDDTFVRFFEPGVGQAAVKVLEAAGYEVRLVEGRKCCGRPSMSAGCLERAKALGEHNVRLISAQEEETPIIFLEPSCHSMFVQDYAELDIAEAEPVAQRCVLFEDFVCGLLEQDPSALSFKPGSPPAAIHAHCHAKALTNAARVRSLPQDVALLDTGCCGMAGQFGQLREKYDLSLQVAQPLVDQLNALAPETVTVASGTSCRHQIAHLTSRHPVHLAEYLASILLTPPTDA